MSGATIIGALCEVRYREVLPDKLRTVVEVVRIGRVEHVYPDGRIAVRTMGGECVSADASQVLVFP